VQPSQLALTAGARFGQRLGPDAHLLGIRAYLHRLFPGKRCTVELIIQN
jgi:hypothetical protein